MRLLLRSLQVGETLFDLLVELEAEPEQRHEPVRVVVLPAKGGVHAARGFAGGLEHRPPVGPGEQAAEEISPSELAHQVGPPPPQARFLDEPAARGPGPSAPRDDVRTPVASADLVMLVAS
ncbi:MAG: hypothetical protein ABMB14_31905, partial [Myxococcota bacterium]